MKNHFRSACVSGLCMLMAAMNMAHAQRLDWVKKAGGANDAAGNAVTTDANGNVIVVGYFLGSADLDPGPGVFPVASSGSGLEINGYIQKFDDNGNFLWGGSIASDTATILHAVRTDAAGNCFILGETWGRADFDIGAGTDSLGSGRSLFLLRIDAPGIYRWAKFISLPTIQYQCSDLLGIDNAANLYLAGGFSNTVDFDLGPGVHNLTSQGSRDGYIAKYDSTGGLVWVSHLEGPVSEEVQGIDVEGTGVYVTGSFRDSIDLDPGPGTLILNDPGPSTDKFIACYTLGGNVTWGKQVDANGAIGYFNSIRADANGNVVAGGNFSGTFDLDPGGGTQTVSSNGASDLFVLKLDGNGDFSWGWSVGGISTDEIFGLAMEDTASVYVTTAFQNTVDFDGGAGVLQLTAASGDAAILKVETSGGGLVWAAQVGSTGGDYSFEVQVDGQENIYCSGSFGGTADFDPSTDTAFASPSSFTDGFVFKWTQDSCSSFAVQIDSVADVACATGTGYLQGHALGGVGPYSYSVNTVPATLDSFAVVSSSGIYTLIAMDNIGCQSERSALLGGPTALSGYDLEVNLVAPPLVPSQLRTLTLDAFNSGCVLISGQLQLILSPDVTYQGANPTPINIAGDTLSWNFPAMNYDSAHFIAEIVVRVDTSAQLGDTLYFGALVTPVIGDEEPLDNIRLDYAFPIRTSYDPNDKSVYPPGACAEHYVLLSDPLTYTIRFQNTGTFEAFEVAILDTLDSDLDLTTVVVKGSSHPMITEVLPGNVLRFAFHDIHLPDSASNEPASHGYVIYEVMPSSGIASGTQVHNGSAIYFDFNPPVITNVVMNTLVSVVPACPVGIYDESVVNKLWIYPNPTTSVLHVESAVALGDVRVMNMLGQVVFHQAGLDLNALAVDAGGWRKGVYVVVAGGVSRRVVVE
jgi:uncharacterized repeat protein (TIGR01451 family)